MESKGIRYFDRLTCECHYSHHTEFYNIKAIHCLQSTAMSVVWCSHSSKQTTKDRSLLSYSMTVSLEDYTHGNESTSFPTYFKSALLKLFYNYLYHIFSRTLTLYLFFLLDTNDRTNINNIVIRYNDFKLIKGLLYSSLYSLFSIYHSSYCCRGIIEILSGYSDSWKSVNSL